ncbi:MAG TPA: patatin-like phospholipase family protein [Rubrivivax sp.]|nr:patatin-like phospholipase family protein [Rubrivivax sp.]
MLTPQLSTMKGLQGRRIGIALAGGGPLGAFYELGALQALSESVEGLDFNDLHAYVGVSSGSMIAAALANGLTPVDMARLIITNESVQFPATPGLFLHPAWGEFAHRVARVPGLAASVLRYYARAPFSRNLAEVLDPLTTLLPNGLFDSAPLERFMRRVLSAPGRSNDFRQLPRKLYIVATDLNTGESARFGEPGMDHVPISRAVQASTALPGLYPPVEIGGNTYADGALVRTMHASLALDAGADLVICINPLVAYDASRGGRRRPDGELTNRGLAVVLGQTFRSLIQSRMLVGLAGYHARFPGSDVLLFEPDRDDEQMFFANVFRYADRRRLVEHAYQRVRADLRLHADALDAAFARHGLRLRRRVLADRRRSFHAAIDQQRGAEARVARDLGRTLRRLDRLVSGAA